MCALLGFERTIAVSGQTYTRKLDNFVLAALSGVAQTMHKFATDLRLLANLKEMEEPFGKNQIGSSAMAYKRNPMRSERICALSRVVMNLVGNTAQTAALQWFERTLDDSANRRIVLSQAFLATDAVLDIGINVVSGLVVYPNVIKSRVMANLPFMATEEILMTCVKAGGDRQILHEAIRVHSMDAAKTIKLEGKPNDLISRLEQDELFKAADLANIIDPAKYVGRAPQQTTEFLDEIVAPVLDKFKHVLEAVEVSALRV